MVNVLLAQRPVAFERRTVDVPDDGGIYVLSNRRTKEVLYVGLTRQGVKSRLKDHWDGNWTSDLANKLVSEGVVENIPDAKVWIKNNVEIRWMIASDLDTCLRRAEANVITVLRPKFNTRGL